jgi:hypothetical protein
MSLVVCRHCERHIRPKEQECPFCSSPNSAKAAEPLPFRPTSRAAVLFFTAASLAGCGKKEADTPTIDVPPSPSASAAATASAPAVDDDAEKKALMEKIRESGAPVAVYGPAPINSNNKRK